MKRKAESQASDSGTGCKKAKTCLSVPAARRRFRAGLFDKPVLDSYARQYATSTPYKHAVIHSLINDTLLRSVREEILNNVEFTPKETDIYKIHQSGDLANLDGLDDASLSKLPSLLTLRDAIYSETFRNYISSITGCGPLSGRKTDMAINVYTPGSYLLCHDDVIGSRRVSYILYLTDPDKPWQPEWGGALRLFPVQRLENKDGEIAKTPLPDAVKAIPPAWNQLSFFAVQPGESFHDVEEVYHAETGQVQQARDGGRVRMAVSGWFHIPQLGEDGYVEGEEEKNAKNSSLMQLQGNPAQYDKPQAQFVRVVNPKASQDEFQEADLAFLLKYLAPTYLIPDTLEQISDHFGDSSCITLANVLSTKFLRRLKDYMTAEEKQPLPADTATIEKTSQWRVARPPHKHRYLYQRPGGPDELRTTSEQTPVAELLDILLPSRQFRHWLQLATGCTIESSDIMARRFRRGLDYTLATGHHGKPRLELNLGITPTTGWGGDDESQDEAEAPDKATANGKGAAKDAVAVSAKEEEEEKDDNEDEVGGHEVYMAGDDDANEDAAVYKSGGDDDNILFFQTPAWNKMTIVLRDRGTLKFVKYVSRKAKGDRWDISAMFDVEDENQHEQHDGGEGGEVPLGESEVEFNGFSDSEDSESDWD